MHLRDVGCKFGVRIEAFGAVNPAAAMPLAALGCGRTVRKRLGRGRRGQRGPRRRSWRRHPWGRRRGREGLDVRCPRLADERGGHLRKVVLLDVCCQLLEGRHAHLALGPLALEHAAEARVVHAGGRKWGEQGGWRRACRLTRYRAVRRTERGRLGLRQGGCRRKRTRCAFWWAVCAAVVQELSRMHHVERGWVVRGQRCGGRRYEAVAYTHAGTCMRERWIPALGDRHVTMCVDAERVQIVRAC